jgi:hypothetical protein
MKFLADLILYHRCKSSYSLLFIVVLTSHLNTSPERKASYYSLTLDQEEYSNPNQ